MRGCARPHRKWGQQNCNCDQPHSVARERSCLRSERGELLPACEREEQGEGKRHLTERNRPEAGYEFSDSANSDCQEGPVSVLQSTRLYVGWKRPNAVRDCIHVLLHLWLQNRP